MAQLAKRSHQLSVNPPEERNRWSYIALQLARGLLLGSFMYGAWYYGGTEPKAMLYSSIAMAFAAILGLVARFHHVPERPMPWPLLIIASLWIAYAGVQMLPIVPQTIPWFKGVVAVQNEFATAPLVDLNLARVSLGGSTSEATPIRATIALDESLWAIVPFLLALAYSYLTWQLFSTSESRRVFLWTIVIHSTLIASWGILQRAAGNSEMLPGVPDRFPGIPFSSFIYKNAGAAAILPGAAAAFLLASLQPHSRSTRSYQAPRRFTHPYQLSLYACVVVICIGLLVSLSRGAWIAAAAATIVTALCYRTRLGWGAIVVAVAVLCGVLITSFVSSGISESVQVRIGELSLDVIAEDERWDQWKDGWKTAIANFPSGSGLGTYGYAVLPVQSQTRTGWFREAHNQYLEVATESGLVGIVLLVTLFSSYLSTCIQTLRRIKDDPLASYAAFGIALFVLAAVQSIADFVIAIPSNLILYACLASLVMSRCLLFDKHARMSGKLATFVGSAVVLCLLVLAIDISRRQIIARNALEGSLITSFEQTSKPENIEEMLLKLDDAVANCPTSPLLYERRAAWHLMKYRAEVIDEAQRRGERVDWRSTDPMNISNYIHSVPDNFRAAITADFSSTKVLRDSLASSLLDFSETLKLNPLRPFVHTEGASVAAFAGFATEPWLDRASRLSNNDSGRLFRNGLVAFASRDDDRMIDQWCKSLAVDSQYIDSIVTLARERLSLQQIARDIYPKGKPYLLVQLAHRVTPPDLALVSDIIAQCEAVSGTPDPDVEAAIAELYQLKGDQNSAATHWEKALSLEPRSSLYRHAYANSLLVSGKAELALDQAVLGRTLHPQDDRFERIVEAARAALSNAK